MLQSRLRTNKFESYSSLYFPNYLTIELQVNKYWAIVVGIEVEKLAKGGSVGTGAGRFFPFFATTFTAVLLSELLATKAEMAAFTSSAPVSFHATVEKRRRRGKII